MKKIKGLYERKSTKTKFIEYFVFLEVIIAAQRLQGGLRGQIHIPQAAHVALYVNLRITSNLLNYVAKS